MKTLILILFVSLFFACNDHKKSSIAVSTFTDTIIIHDTIWLNADNNWQEGFGLAHDAEIDSIWGNPVKFYIDNPKCSPIAIDFYQGQFKPTDNNTTASLLSLVTTNNKDLRPFYRWCLNKTIQIQDGALGEYTGVPARKYAEKYPSEFFEYIDSDSTKTIYQDWINSISYSGFYDIDDYKKPNEIRKRMISKMKQNCKDCNDNLIKRIVKFTNDCFQE